MSRAGVHHSYFEMLKKGLERRVAYNSAAELQARSENGKMELTLDQNRPVSAHHTGLHKCGIRRPSRQKIKIK